jgi:hypothetical protein
MLKIISSKKTRQIALVTGSKQNKWDNLNNVRHEASKHFRTKQREYLKDKINELGRTANQASNQEEADL